MAKIPIAAWAERSGKISRLSPATFTGVPLTAPFPLQRPSAPALLTLHLIFEPCSPLRLF